MFRWRHGGLLLLALAWLPASNAREQGAPLVEISFEEALALAREQAPRLAAARARVGEAQGRATAAELRPYNPELSAEAGPREVPGERVTDWSLGLEQRFELGGQRRLRAEAARAGVDAARAEGDDAQRMLVREVALAFVSALYRERRVTLAAENVRLAEDVARVARERHEVGDIGGLEASVSELALVRAEGDVDRAEADLARAKGRLVLLLGLDASSELALDGDLRRLGVPEGSPGPLDERPDLRALEADIRQAEVEAELGRAKRLPDLALGASVAREESADIFKGSVSLAIPLFDRGQGEVALAKARRARLRAELEAATSAARAEAGSAAEVARRLASAALRFEERGLGTLERAEELARGSYQAGAIPLGELLALQRELVFARLDYVGLLYGAARARVELASITGALR